MPEYIYASITFSVIIVLLIFRIIISYAILSGKIKFNKYCFLKSIFHSLVFILANILNIIASLFVKIEHYSLICIMFALTIYSCITLILDIYSKRKTKEYIKILEEDVFLELPLRKIFNIEKTKYEVLAGKDFKVQMFSRLKDDKGYGISFSELKDNVSEQAYYVLTFKDKTENMSLNFKRFLYVYDQLNILDQIKDIEELKEAKIRFTKKTELYNYYEQIVLSDKIKCKISKKPPIKINREDGFRYSITKKRLLNGIGELSINLVLLILLILLFIYFGWF